MSTFDYLQRKPGSISSTLAASTTSFLRPSRPFAPLPTSASQQASPDQQTQPTNGTLLSFSLANISILPPTPQEGKQLQTRIQAARSSGQPLEKKTQRRLEQGLGADLSNVRVHIDSEADRLSRSVDALAFTTGSDIFFRSGMYNPSTQEGMHLLAHESTHTIQQASGLVRGTLKASDLYVSDPDDCLEQAADKSAAHVLARQHSTQVQQEPAATSISPLFQQRLGMERVRPVQSMMHGTPVIQRLKAKGGSDEVNPEFERASLIIERLNQYQQLQPNGSQVTIGIASTAVINTAGALWAPANPNRLYLAPQDKGKPRGWQANFMQKAAAAADFTNPMFNLHVSSTG